MYRHRREVHNFFRGSAINAGQHGPGTSQPTPAKVRKIVADQPNSNLTNCSTCQVDIPTKSYFAHLRSNQHKAKCCQSIDMKGVMLLNTAFRGRIASYRIPAEHQTIDYEAFLRENEEKVYKIINMNIIKHGSVKVNVELFGKYFLKTSGEYSIKSFNTKNEIATIATNLETLYSTFTEAALTKARDFNENKSGNLITSKNLLAVITFLFCRVDVS